MFEKSHLENVLSPAENALKCIHSLNGPPRRGLSGFVKYATRDAQRHGRAIRYAFKLTPRARKQKLSEITSKTKEGGKS